MPSLAPSLPHSHHHPQPYSRPETLPGGQRPFTLGSPPQRRPQKRLDKRLEEVAKGVGGGYCRLQMPLNLELGVRETAAGHRLGSLEWGSPLIAGKDSGAVREGRLSVC